MQYRDARGQRGRALRFAQAVSSQYKVKMLACNGIFAAVFTNNMIALQSSAFCRRTEGAYIVSYLRPKIVSIFYICYSISCFSVIYIFLGRTSHSHIPSLCHEKTHPLGCALRGGESGVRTRDTCYSMHAFQACAFSRSAISPCSAPIAYRARYVYSCFVWRYSPSVYHRLTTFSAKPVLSAILIIVPSSSTTLP